MGWWYSSLPLPVFYHQDYSTDIISSNGVTPEQDPRVRSQGFLRKEQRGIPKLDKKMWYGISGVTGDETLNYIIAKKSDTWKPDERGSWIKEKTGSYWSGEHDEAIHLVRGDLITQDDLTKYYNNSMKLYSDYDPKQVIVHSFSPMTDTAHICRYCGKSNRMGKDCSCGMSSKQQIPLDLFDKGDKNWLNLSPKITR